MPHRYFTFKQEYNIPGISAETKTKLKISKEELTNKINAKSLINVQCIYMHSLK